MKIILLFEPNPMVESTCLYSNSFRNDSYQKMAIMPHENSKERRSSFNIEYNSSISYLMIYRVIKLKKMVESACLRSKSFRNDSYQKMAIIHHENSKERPFYPHFVQSILPQFLTRCFKTKYENHTSLQPQSNSGIRVSVLQTVQK